MNRSKALLLSADDFQEPSYSEPTVCTTDESTLLNSSDVTVVQNESYSPIEIDEKPTAVNTSRNAAYGVLKLTSTEEFL